MPIYAYKCGSCGHAKDVLQKISDAPLTTCPSCGAEAFSKQLTAAGFQLKGSGWYVTDFRGGSGGSTGSSGSSGSSGAAPSTSSSEGGAGGSESPSASASSDAPAAAGGCGGSCACH